MECNIDNLCYYFGHKEIVWGVHMVIGLVFIALFALYMNYKDKQDQESVKTHKLDYKKTRY